MQIQPTSPAAGQSDNSAVDSMRTALTVANRMNNLAIADRQFSVVRDPGSDRFVIVMRDSKSGDVLDQFPPKEVLRMLAQLTSQTAEKPGEILA
jgi:uncharacterized FlaG/YvyC family protein